MNKEELRQLIQSYGKDYEQEWSLFVDGEMWDGDNFAKYLQEKGFKIVFEDVSTSGETSRAKYIFSVESEGNKTYFAINECYSSYEGFEYGSVMSFYPVEQRERKVTITEWVEK